VSNRYLLTEAIMQYEQLITQIPDATGLTSRDDADGRLQRDRPGPSAILTAYRRHGSGNQSRSLGRVG
jgi:hypothetical protein